MDIVEFKSYLTDDELKLFYANTKEDRGKWLGVSRGIYGRQGMLDWLMSTVMLEKLQEGDVNGFIEACDCLKTIILCAFVWCDGQGQMWEEISHRQELGTKIIKTPKTLSELRKML